MLVPMKLRDMARAVVSKKRRGVAWYKVSQKQADKYGFYVYSSHMIWKDQPFFRKALQRVKNIRGIPDPRAFVLQSCLRSIERIDGDVAECGVRQGRSTIFMLMSDLRPRHYHLFDSFAGLSEPTAEDRKPNGRTPWKSGDLSTDEKIARENISGFSNTTFHVGWIPETFSSVSDRRFALVHIDVDLYEPTRDALAFFYDRVCANGMIICDDYGSGLCPGARKAFDQFFENRPEGIIELPTGQAIVVKAS
ncbi:MAG: methyltransferase [Mesorhizobium sp.]|uniref:TylF/MycF/NovP-related O-methyltransferase n=3 Tax=unclassified Mesorhizobium TaxID=325217 RepID=UPI000FCA74DF|nr:MULTISPECIES: TylF/MycF/NovP-related O-methyltransferase [unclassified Mesorhizobium]RUV76920.1 methyltransferase [Mesorhizobium sp. M5C.F.Cr.IN.023.01.1.1]RWF90558.1 MAG: methyltransferase [Mesorhizobium sp.]RWF96742.1 MAG: methyltransferase [Mesorhizobium sp.]RWI41668.1 MAG: methyltransferase [Mesorhizobium sp.]RWI50852.1 MAG: methyltransferase [Mesorhizobium sp.]